MKRAELLKELAGRITEIELAHPVRVSIDGVDAAGKTTLAQELAPLIQARGRIPIRASIDDFHNPACIRYQRGNDSPEGFYYDSFNYIAVVELLLVPLGPGGGLQYRSAIFDHRTDSEIKGLFKAAEVNAVLLFDGIFLLRPELRRHWDFTIFVDTALDVSLVRAMRRDLGLFGSADEVRNRYERRYIPGQELYFKKCKPKERANVVVDNNDPSAPVLLPGRNF